MSSDQTVKSWNLSLCPLEEWKYCQPADLTKAFKIYGKERKFCPKCKCHATGKEGTFQLSHWAKDHLDGYGQQNSNIWQSSINSSPNFTVIENSAPSANLSHFVTDPSSGIPSGPPELSINEASSQCKYSSDEISFLGIWCVPSNAEKKPSVKITHISQSKEHEGSQLEETAESVEDIENEDC